MKRRLLSVMLSLTMASSLIPPTAVFADSDQDGAWMSEESAASDEDGFGSSDSMATEETDASTNETDESTAASDDVSQVEPTQVPGFEPAEGADGITITRQPENVKATPGSEFEISISATGNNLSYTWFRYNGKRWVEVGEDSDTYIGHAYNDLNGSQYMCVLSDEEGNELESDIVTLTVSDEFEIVSQPVDAGDVLYGETARFEVEAKSLNEFYYNWMWSPDGITWEYAGSSDSVLEVTANNDTAGFYMCQITTENGDEINSDVVTFNLVYKDINILGDQGCDDEENGIISYFYNYNSCVYLYADVENYSGIDYSYDWECNDGEDWYSRGYNESSDVSGEYDTENQVSRVVLSGDIATDAEEGRQYRLHIMDSQGQEAYSRVFTMTITPTSFDWISHPAIGTGSEDGVILDEYTESVDCPYDGEIELYAKFKPTWGMQAIEFTGFEWEWEYNSGDGWFGCGSYNNWQEDDLEDTSEEGNTIFTTMYRCYGNDDEDNRQYRVHIWDQRGTDIYSEPVTVNVVKEKLEITKQPESQEVFFHDEAVFTVEAEGRDIEYQWQCYNAKEDQWIDYFYNGWNDNAYRDSTLYIRGDFDTDGARFRCRIWDSQNQEIYTDEVTLTVNQKEQHIELLTETEDGVLGIEYGEPVVLEANLIDNENINTWFNWQIYWPDGEGWDDIGCYEERNDGIIKVGLNGWNSYPNIDGAKFRLHVEDEQGLDLYSDEITFKVLREEIKITVQPEDTHVSMFNEFTLKIAAQGKDLQYCWQRSKDEIEWEDFYWTNETPYLTETLNPNTMDYKYRCRIQDSQEQEVYSDVVSVSLEDSITSVAEGEYTDDVSGRRFFEFIPSVSGKYLICSTGKNWDVTGESYDTYGEIYDSEWGYIDSDDDRGDENNFAFAVDLTAGEKYYICVRYFNTDLTGEINWKIEKAAESLSIENQTGNAIIAEGEYTEFSVDAIGINLSYHWYYSKNGGEMWKPIYSENNVLRIRGTRSNNGYMYYCRAEDMFGNSISSEPMLLTVSNAELIVVTPETDVTVLENDEVTLSVEAKGNNLNYEWYYSKNNGRTWRRAYHYDSEYSFNAALTQNGYKYYCSVSDDYDNEESSDEITLTVKEDNGEKNIRDASVELETDTFEYTGKVIKPELVVRYDGEELTEGVDYEVVTNYKEYTPLGDSRISINGIGNYYGRQYVTIHVVEAEISEILVVTDPYKTTYLCGQNFESEGMVFAIKYVNGASRSGNAEELGIGLEADLSVADPNVKVSYGEYSFNYPVTVSHDIVIDEAVEPTEEETGLTEGSHCGGCGEIIKAQEVIDKLVVFKITKQPENVTTEKGETVEFSVEATGNGLTYQWQYRTSASGAWKNFAAATTATIRKVTGNWNGWQVKCVIKDSEGNSLESDIVTVSFGGGEKEPITIKAQPKNVTTQKGETVEFSVEAEGTGLTYQWQYRTSASGKWKNFASATTPTIQKVTGDWDGWQVKCVIKDSEGNSLDSDVATISFGGSEKEPITIKTQPKNVVTGKGELVEFSVEAEGTGLTYQWQYRTSASGSWKNFSSAKTATIQKLTGDWDGWQVKCVIKDSAGNTLDSDIVTVSFGSSEIEPITIKTQPQDVTTSKGETVEFSVEAEGTGLTYQWQYRTSASGSWKNFAAATTASIRKVTGDWNGWQVRCVIKDGNGQSVTTNTATIKFA